MTYPFEKPNTLNVAVQHTLELIQPMRAYKTNLFEAIAYYKRQVKYVKANHILAQIITMLDLPRPDMSSSYFNAYVAERAEHVARLFKLTTSEIYGKCHPGYCFGNLYKELYLYDASPFDIVFDETHWQNISPVRVITHNKNDLSMLATYGKVTTSESGLAIMSINVRRLAFNYRCFQRWNLSGNHGLSLVNYIGMFIIPNMLKSLTDIALMNRIMSIYYNEPLSEVLINHPYYKANYIERLDKGINTLLTNLDHTDNKYYAAMAEAIPALARPNMDIALILPDVLNTQQNDWVLIYGRLRYFIFFADIGGTKGTNLERVLIERYQRRVKFGLNNNRYTKILPEDHVLQLKKEQTILNLL